MKAVIPVHRSVRRADRSAARIWAALWSVPLAVTLAVGPAGAAEATLADLTLEQLLNESVVSVSKRESTINESPAAISVISGDDLRRLYVTTLPEALRWSPGLDVARISANQWAISSRGFNYQFANKLLVMVDGRTIYTPAFAGVFWDAADTVLEDINRIEVIRGPGATLWGANAVNGVINVITKSARSTQGLLATTTEGTEEQLNTTVRYGGHTGRDFFYRVYVKQTDRNGLVDAAGRDALDDWGAVQTGFRADWTNAGPDAFTLQGDYFSGTTRQNHREVMFVPPFARDHVVENRNHGANVLGRWTHDFSATSQLTVQSFIDHSLHGGPNSNETRDTVDFDLQHYFAWGGRHETVWGLGYRNNFEENTSTPNLIWDSTRRPTQLWTGFVQDQIALVPERLRLVAGVKVEENSLVSRQVQPGVRVLWKPGSHETFWAAASHADRTPSGFETGSRLNNAVFQPAPNAPVMASALLGTGPLKSEELYSYELGWRAEAKSHWSLDLSTFFNRYYDLIGYNAVPNLRSTDPVPHIVVPLVAANNDAARTWGAEAALQFRPADGWRITANYSWLQMRLRNDRTREGDSPRHQAHLRCAWDFRPGWELNAATAYVGGVVNSISEEKIPAYVRLDLGVTWHVRPSFEVSAFGQNLLDPQHQEFGSLQTPFRTQIPRSWNARITWRY